MLAGLLLAACGKPPPLEHDAYVWQRRWQAPVVSAIADSADLVSRWRILAAEVDARGRFHAMPVDFSALAASGRPAIAVIRIEAPLASLDQASLLARLEALQRTWQASPATLAGLEIDHDCATRHLEGYRNFLRALRPGLARGLPLSITLLPDWLQSPVALQELLAAADEGVLQLHSLRNPTGRLFDPASAKAWTADMARLAAAPFRLALPTYGSRLFTDEKGQITAIESEGPAGQAGGREAYAPPKAVAAFLRELESQPPANLSGIVWFRLPVSADVRAWSHSTWRAVIAGTDLPVRLGTERIEDGGRQILYLRNEGDMDAELPAALALEKPCAGIAGSGFYGLEETAAESTFLRRERGLLRAGSRLAVGSLQCAEAGGKVHIQP